MKLVFISGPSGSGKSTLSRKIIERVKNGIVLSTDNYYKTGLISKLLSRIIKGYFDRRISFNYKLFKKDFNFIYKNRIAIYERSYNFKKKKIKNLSNEKTNINLLIVEGIFAKDLSSNLYDKNYFLLELKTNKNDCRKRVIQRDLKERGKSKKRAEKDFLNSWNIYYGKLKNRHAKIITNEFVITKKTNINNLLTKILN